MTDNRSDWDKAPLWFKWALHEIGVKETPGGHSTDRVIEYRKLGGFDLDGDDGSIPWCKIFVNAAMKQSGIPIRINAMARSIETDPNFVRLPGPALGAVASFWRISRKNGSGHTGFYRGETLEYVYLLDGNTQDDVGIGPVARNAASFGLVGYYWPKSIPLPVIGAIPIRAGQPIKNVSVV